MDILVIGATRGIGFQLLQQALAAGHATTVLARQPKKITIENDLLTVVSGDILEPKSVEEAIAGRDAVCCCIGINPTRKPVTVFSQGIQNVLSAMARCGVKNLVTVTGIGAGDSKGHGGFFYDRILNPLLLKTIYEDKDREEEIVRQSDVDWIIVRPGFLTNGPLRGEYRTVTDMTGVKAGKISRADVAHFILSQLATPTFLKKTVLLAY